MNNNFLETESICKIFADDRPFCTVVDDDAQSQNTVYEDFFVSWPTSGICFLILIFINKKRKFVFHENEFIPQISHQVLLTTQFKYALLRNASFFIQLSLF